MLRPSRESHHWLATVAHVSTPPVTSSGVRAGTLHLNGLVKTVALVSVIGCADADLTPGSKHKLCLFPFPEVPFNKHAMPETLGIIAGSRSLPLELARHARAAGVKRLVAVGFVNETNPEI